MRTPELLKKLADYYPSGAYAFLTQVRNGTGYEKEARTADAMVMSLWPSRGIHLTGFEIKVSRSDWLHEYMQPEKAEAIAQYCDYWYLVVADAKIVQGDELPKNWGLMIPDGKGGKMKIHKEAVKMKPKPVDRLFLAAIFRNITDKMVAKELIQDQLTLARQQGKESAGYAEKRIQDQYDSLFDRVKAFEKTSGVSIDSWSAGDIGKAVKDCLEGKDKNAAARIKALRETASNILKYIEGEIKQYEI